MPDFLYHQYIVQGLGLLAFGFGVWAFSCKDDARLKKVMTVQCLVLTAHFFLLGARSGAIVALLTAVRAYTSLYKKIRHVAPVFIVLYVVMGMYQYQSWVDGLPIIASVVATIGFFYLGKIPMRLCSLFATTMWLIHNFVVGSIAPFFMEVFILVVMIRTIYVLYKEQNHAEDIQNT